MLSPPSSGSPNDLELLARYKKTGDLNILGELYQRYATLVLGVCLKYLKDREESKDAVMQIFEKLIESLKTHEIIHFKSWLYTLSKNHCLMQLRARKGRQMEEISPFLMESNGDPHQDDDQQMEWNLVRLEKCLEQLADEQKQCVELFYLGKKCYQEIVVLTGFDYKQVKSFIQNGKRNLKICLDNG